MNVNYSDPNFPQYQQNEQPYITLNHWKHTHPSCSCELDNEGMYARLHACQAWKKKKRKKKTTQTKHKNTNSKQKLNLNFSLFFCQNHGVWPVYLYETSCTYNMVDHTNLLQQTSTSTNLYSAYKLLRAFFSRHAFLYMFDTNIYSSIYKS